MIDAETVLVVAGLWSWPTAQRLKGKVLLGGAGLACSASSALRWWLCLSRDPRSWNRRLSASPVKARRRAGSVDAWFALVFALLIVVEVL